MSCSKLTSPPRCGGASPRSLAESAPEKVSVDTSAAAVIRRVEPVGPITCRAGAVGTGVTFERLRHSALSIRHTSPLSRTEDTGGASAGHIAVPDVSTSASVQQRQKAMIMQNMAHHGRCRAQRWWRRGCRSRCRRRCRCTRSRSRSRRRTHPPACPAAAAGRLRRCSPAVLPAAPVLFVWHFQDSRLQSQWCRVRAGRRAPAPSRGPSGARPSSDRGHWPPFDQRRPYTRARALV